MRECEAPGTFRSGMIANLRLLFGLLWQPLTALRQLRERAPVAFSVGVAWLMTALYILLLIPLVDFVQRGPARLGTMRGGSGVMSGILQLLMGGLFRAALSALMVVLFVSVIYVPFVILLGNVFERRASFGLVIREEFASVLACTLSSLAISVFITILPAAIISWQGAFLSSNAVVGYFILLLVIPLPIFAALMTLTLGTVFQIGWVAAVGSTLISLISLAVMPFFMQAATFLCASPFLLLLLIFLLRDRIDDFMRNSRARQSFKQNLEAATLNPADASAHYNLGLLYQQRGDRVSAASSFQKAVEIDDQETDAHYQLGRILRETGDYARAIMHFEKVVHQNPSHSHHEIWREIGLVYFSAGQHRDALEMFDRFLAERASDAQGHYWRGMTLHQLGRLQESLREMQDCIESVKTAPAYKYRTDRQWLHLAQNFLRERS